MDEVVAGDVSIISRQGCAGVQAGGRGKVGRVVHSLQSRVGRKTERLGAWKARIDAMEKKEGVEGEPSIPFKEGGDSEDVWGDCMEVEDEAESRKKLDEPRKKMQKELREVHRLSFVSKEMQESIKESLQNWLQDVEKRRKDLMPEHQKVRKRSQKIQSTWTEEEICRKKVRQQKRKCGNSERKLIGKKSAIVSSWTESIKTEWQKRKWKHNFRDRKLEKKEKVATHRKRLIVAWKRWWSRFSRWEQIKRGLSSMRRIETPSAQMPGKEDGETVKMNKSKEEPVSSWCYQRQAGSIKVHRRVVWSLIFIVFRVYLVKAEVQEDQAHKGIAREVHPDLLDDIPWMRKRMTMWEEWCLKQKRKKNSQRKGPNGKKQTGQGPYEPWKKTSM